MTVEDDILEYIRWNRLFTTSAESGPMFVSFNILFRYFYQYPSRKSIPTGFLSKFYLQNAALLNSKEVTLTSKILSHAM